MSGHIISAQRCTVMAIFSHHHQLRGQTIVATAYILHTNSATVTATWTCNLSNLLILPDASLLLIALCSVIYGNRCGIAGVQIEVEHHAHTQAHTHKSTAQQVAKIHASAVQNTTYAQFIAHMCLQNAKSVQSHKLAFYTLITRECCTKRISIRWTNINLKHFGIWFACVCVLMFVTNRTGRGARVSLIIEKTNPLIKILRAFYHRNWMCMISES